jgi:hypothetical protein
MKVKHTFRYFNSIYLFQWIKILDDKLKENGLSLYRPTCPKMYHFFLKLRCDFNSLSFTQRILQLLSLTRVFADVTSRRLKNDYISFECKFAASIFTFRTILSGRGTIRLPNNTDLLVLNSTYSMTLLHVKFSINLKHLS